VRNRFERGVARQSEKAPGAGKILGRYGLLGVRKVIVCVVLIAVGEPYFLLGERDETEHLRIEPGDGSRQVSTRSQGSLHPPVRKHVLLVLTEPCKNRRGIAAQLGQTRPRAEEDHAPPIGILLQNGLGPDFFRSIHRHLFARHRREDALDEFTALLDAASDRVELIGQLVCAHARYPHRQRHVEFPGGRRGVGKPGFEIDKESGLLSRINTLRIEIAEGDSSRPRGFNRTGELSQHVVELRAAELNLADRRGARQARQCTDLPEQRDRRNMLRRYPFSSIRKNYFFQRGLKRRPPHLIEAVVRAGQDVGGSQRCGFRHNRRGGYHEPERLNAGGPVPCLELIARVLVQPREKRRHPGIGVRISFHPE